MCAGIGAGPSAGDQTAVATGGFVQLIGVAAVRGALRVAPLPPAGGGGIAAARVYAPSPIHLKIIFKNRFAINGNGHSGRIGIVGDPFGVAGLYPVCIGASGAYAVIGVIGFIGAQ